MMSGLGTCFVGSMTFGQKTLDLLTFGQQAQHEDRCWPYGVVIAVLTKQCVGQISVGTMFFDQKPCSRFIDFFIILLLCYVQIQSPLGTIMQNVIVSIHPFLSLGKRLSLMEECALQNVNNCLNTNIYSYLEISGGQSSNLYLNVVQFFNTSVN